MATQVKDEASFQRVSADPNQVAALYYYATLDCLVGLATKVAHDFFDRPHLYTSITPPAKAGPKDLEEELAALHAREGSHELYLGQAQRDQIFTALFGAHGDTSASFVRLRNELLDASAAFAERVFDTGVDMLRERVRLAHRPFKEYLTGLQGSSVKWSSKALTSLHNGTSHRILRDDGIAAVFGIAKPPVGDWPYLADSNGDKLVEEISRQLRWHARPHETIAVGEPMPTHTILTRERFSNLQRAAVTGTVAIREVLDFTAPGTNVEVATLITACYSWGSALLAVERPSASEGPSYEIQPPGLVAAGPHPRPVGGRQ